MIPIKQSKLHSDTIEAIELAASMFADAIYDPTAIHDTSVCLSMAIGIELDKRDLPKPLVANWITKETYLTASDDTFKLGSRTSLSPASPKAYLVTRLDEFIRYTVENIEESLRNTNIYRPCIWIYAEKNKDEYSSNIDMQSTFFHCAEKPGNFSIDEIKGAMMPMMPVMEEGFDLC